MKAWLVRAFAPADKVVTEIDRYWDGQKDAPEKMTGKIRNGLVRRIPEE